MYITVILRETIARRMSVSIDLEYDDTEIKYHTVIR